MDTDQIKLKFRQYGFLYIVGFFVAAAMLVTGNILMSGATVLHKISAAYCLLFSVVFFSAPFISAKVLSRIFAVFAVIAVALNFSV